MHVLLFANGDVNDGEMVQRALAEAQTAHILCADGGAHHALNFGLQPQTIIGDLDSLGAEKAHELEQAGVRIYRHPPEKDETDLELAFYWCIEQGASWIRMIGGLGGRFDQTLANVYLLALPALADIDVEIVDGKQAIRLLHAGHHTIIGQKDDTISLIPLGGTTSGITTENLQYSLHDESLEFGPARGVSNVMLKNTASISIREGTLLMVHTVGRA